MTDISRESKREDTSTPLLLNESREPSSEQASIKHNTCKTIGEISRYSLWPIVGMMFHPLYSLINAAVVGRMEKKFLAALGLGSLTTGICLISIGCSFSLVLGSFVAPAHGKGDAKLARMYLHRQYLLNCFVFLTTLIPIFFIN